MMLSKFRNMKRLKVQLIVASFLISVFGPGVYAMGSLNPFKVCAFSRFEGVISKDGKPVQGAVVEQIADYRGKIVKEKAVTDNNGLFSFESKYLWSLAPIMFDTFVFQEIYIYWNDEEYQAWKTVKQNGFVYGELDALQEKDRVKDKIVVNCDLTGNDKERKVIKTRTGFNSIWGLCSWDGAQVVDHERYPAELE